jgi:3-oxoacyl-[acyl-carrier protein] reductase
MSELQGKTALVTGASRGIGAAIARRLAGDGADVAVTYVNGAEKADAVVREVEAAGGRGVAIRADSADPQAVQAAVDKAAAELGRLDILVSNAGIGLMGPVEEVTLEDLDRILAIHVKAAFVGARAAARHMDRGGRIIGIGSCLAERVPDPGATIYAASKAALMGLTKGLARDLGPRGITVNLVQPGPIDTDMNPADGPMAEGERRHIALGHFGTAEDVAAMVAHLSGEGGRFISGAAIAVDGGFGA